jgi:RNA polymerase-interacting CarD/CdnL/TRCF family regulator
MLFKVGDQVIHPRHGLGQVTSLAIRQFTEGEKRPYYEIAFPGSTLWAPLDRSTSGLRKLSVRSEVAACRRLLAAAPAPLDPDPRQRLSELAARLKQGTLSAHCEVVRDLSAHHRIRPLSGAVAALLATSLDVLRQEWAEVEGRTPAEAGVEIEALLEKGRRAGARKKD